MKQSRGTSFLKSLISTVVGFGVAMVANALVLPFFGFHPSFAENISITCVYTGVSIARSYVLERLFEALGWRARMSAFALAVLAERQRQIQTEGWSEDHDDDHYAGELARAGAAYAIYARAHLVDRKSSGAFTLALSAWPWSGDWWKPTGFRRDLVKAAALILAEGEKFDRSRGRKPNTDGVATHG